MNIENADISRSRKKGSFVEKSYQQMFHWHKQPVFLLLNSWHGIRARFKNTESNDIGGKNLSARSNN